MRSNPNHMRQNHTKAYETKQDYMKSLENILYIGIGLFDKKIPLCFSLSLLDLRKEYLFLASRNTIEHPTYYNMARGY